jgi:hypothetical protein
MNMPTIIRRIAKASAALILAASAAATVGATSAQAAEAERVNGCPSGAVCIYPRNAGFNNDRPSDVFFSYGAHNLENQFGKHYVFNNQVEGASVRLCTGFNGTGCRSAIEPGDTKEPNLTPINSILLVPFTREPGRQLP